MPQPQPRQQPGLNDIQMLQRHIMLKQLQELRRHQQLQELGDGRQQNHLNQVSAMNKQAAGGQVLPLINGTPIHDASQMLMAGNITLVHHGASPAGQGFPNGLYSQAQSQDLQSMGLVPQQLEMSLYGTPIATPRNNMNQYSHPQGLSRYTANLFTKGTDNETEKPLMQSSEFGSSFLGENCNVSSEQLFMPDGAFLSKQLPPGKKLGQVPMQGFSSGILPENFQQVNALHRNASAQEFNERQVQVGWPENFLGNTTQIESSQGLTTLDPLEQKILFNLDDNWNASFGRKADMGTGGFGNSLEGAGYASSFPSIQSGSWSALMQSAVAETSSSDTGLQEEWSGLSFQNTEVSTDNQHSNFVESGNRQTGWVDNNVQSASSPSCKPQLLFHDSNISSEFPGFQQSGIQFSMGQREGMRSDSPHESVQQSPKWLHQNPQQDQPIEGSHNIQHLENTWPFQYSMHSGGNAQQQNVSSYNNGPQNGTMYKEKGPDAYGKRQNYHQREKLNDSYHSNASQHTITEDGARENMWPHATDAQSLSQHNQKSSGQSQVLCQEVSQGSRSHQQGYFSQFKECLPDIPRNSKLSEEVPPRGNIGANLSASFDRSAGIYGSNLISDTRQNMFELLHKGDYTREQRTVTNISSTDSSPILEAPEAETPKSYDQSSGSQRFGLKLAPPSQQLPNSNRFWSMQSPSQSGTSPPVAGYSPQATLPGMASRLPQYTQDTSQGTSQPVSISFGRQFPFLETVSVSQAPPTSFLSQQVRSSTAPRVQTNLLTQPHLSAAEPSELPSDMLVSADSINTNLLTPPCATKELHDQNSYRGTVSRESVLFSMNSQGFAYGEEHPGKKRSQQQIPSDNVDQASHTGELFYGQESVAKHLSEANAMGCGSSIAQHHRQNFDSAWHAEKHMASVSARDLEAFGRSLKPSNIPNNYSLLHQASSLNNVKGDLSRMVSKENHEAGSSVNDPTNSGLNVAAQLNSFPPRDVKMLSFSSEVGDDQSIKASSLLLQEMATPDQSYSQSDTSCNNTASNKTEHSQISLQMAPSWYKNYETLKNGQILPMYDRRTGMNSTQQFPFENLLMNTSTVQVNAAGASQVNSLQSTTATKLALGKLAPPLVLPPDVGDWNLSVTGLKKRKVVVCELLPWHKEVTQSSKRLHTISEAELEWAEAANRFVEKVEDEAEVIEEGQPLLRVKKRLVLTTQLMQQLFGPAPSAILSADATSNYDSMAYFAAKLALSDACNLTSCSRSDSCSSSDGYDMMSEKSKISERSGEQYITKVMEDFVSRAKKLESSLFRLVKGSSIVDIRVECHELEKFSIFNRFAKFHTRAQPDAAETSSSTTGATPTVPKSFPQRYVTAFPMPRIVPEGAQCLPL